ncbi:MAG: hypothetical protein K2K28_04465, partial [Clostridia bacterium]|nr:hypothetical protein [Clostridia bacterium]
IKLKDYAPEAIPEGYYLAGWSLIDGGEAVFDAKAEIGYSALEEYNSPKMSLYPVFKEGNDPAEMQLSVAVYKQYVEEELIQALMQAFEEYCNGNGLAGGELSYVMIGDDDTKVGEFCSEVTAGDFNIIFGHRANLTIDVIGNADTLLKVNGTARRIAKLSERTLSNAFYDFVLNDPAAKKILDSTYISESEADKITVTLMNGTVQYGENLTVSNATDAAKVTLPVLEAEEGFEFKGWALTAEAADGETLLKGVLTYTAVKDLSSSGALTLFARFEKIPEIQVPTVVIGYWSYSDYVTDEVAEVIKTEFEDFLKSKGIGEYKVELREFTNSKVAALVDAIQDDGGIDYFIGGGKNITSTSGTVS